MKIHNIITATALTFPMLATAAGSSPYLPIPGEVALTINHTEQSGDEAYIGDQELSFPAITGGAADEYERSTTTFLINYGLNDNVALDGQIGYSDVEVGRADNDSGISDAMIGISWRIVDEFLTENSPTVTLHAAAIIKGSYDNGERLGAVGKDEGGFEVSVLLGKQITNSLSITGELGYENRTGNVPDAHFYSVNANYSLTDRWGLSAGYSFKEYNGSLDIGGPGFTPARFQEVNEERELLKFGVGYAISGNQGVSLNFATVVDGRNTVKDDEIIGVSYTYAF